MKLDGCESSYFFSDKGWKIMPIVFKICSLCGCSLPFSLIMLVCCDRVHIELFKVIVLEKKTGTLDSGSARSEMRHDYEDYNGGGSTD